MVVKAVRPQSLDALPETARAIALVHPDSPRASTTRQDFGDIEFDADRALGKYFTRAEHGRWTCSTAFPNTVS
jgi:hypothetical protein